MSMAINPLVRTATFYKLIKIHLKGRIQCPSRIAVEFLAHRWAMVGHDNFAFGFGDCQCRLQPMQTTLMKPIIME